MEFNQPEDEFAFFKRLNEGDQKCFSQVFEEYSRQLLYFSKRIVNDIEDAQDIIAEVFIKLYRGLNGKLSFDSESKLKSFLYITTRNDSLTHLRDLKKITATNSGLEVLTDPFDAAIDQRWIHSELMDEIFREINKLPERQGEIFILINFVGLSNLQVANLLGISVSTVKTTNSKATEKLRIVFSNKPMIMLLLFSICAN